MAYWDIHEVEGNVYFNCVISLQVDGYEFRGYGVMIGEWKIVNDLWCKTPDGVVIQII